MGRLSAFLLISFALALICVPARGEITGWTTLSAPAQMSDLDVVTFAVLSLGSDLSLLVFKDDDPNALTESISVTLNGNNIFSGNLTELTTIDPVINQTTLNALPAGIELELLVELFDESGTLINSTTVHPAMTNAFSTGGELLVTTYPFNALWVPPESMTFGCAFTGNLHTLESFAKEEGLTNTFNCTLVGYNPVALHVQAGSTFQFTLYSYPSYLSIPNGPAGGVQIVAPAYIDQASSSIAESAKVCANTFEIDVTGGFYVDHFYSCVIQDAKNKTHRSNFAAPMSNATVRCLFNTSDIIVLKSVGSVTFPNVYQIITLLDSNLASGANPVPVDTSSADIWPKHWIADSCLKKGSSVPVWGWILIAVFAVLVVAGMLFIVFRLFMARRSDAERNPILGRSVNA